MIHETICLDMAWYWLSRRYRSELAARSAFNQLEALGKQRHGELHLGVYRHGHPEGEADTVTVVSHVWDGMEDAERVLAQGVDVQQRPENIEALILRRAQVLRELVHGGAPPGSYAIHRGRGARINRDGSVEEQIGGDQ